jgi:ArsR family transcriptional regulator
MLWMLGEGELCGCEFAPRLGLDPSVVSRHLAALQRAGLIRSRREGVRLMWNLTDPGILRVLDELKELVREKEVVS